jgi:hypothetical protein
MDKLNTLDAVLVFPPPMDRVDRVYPAPHFLSHFLNARGFNTKTADLNLAALLSLAQSAPLRKKGPRIESTRDLMEMEISGIRFTRIFRDIYKRMFSCLYETGEFSCDTILGLSSSPEMERMADLVHPAMMRDIVSSRPLLVGFSIPFSQQLAPAVALAGRLKALMGRVHICFGGPVVTLAPESVLNDMKLKLPVDSFVRYQGELPLEGLLETLGARRSQATRHLNPDEIYDFNRFGKTALAQMPKTARIPIRQSAGCYWRKCTFCDYVNLHRDKSYRPRPVDRIISDILYYTRLGFRNFRMLSEAIPPAPALKIAKAILKEVPKISWHAFIRVDKGFTPDIFKYLRQSGFTCTVGMESASNRVLKILNKGYDQETIVSFVDHMKAAGFGGNHLNVMVGVPRETRKDALKTLVFCSQCKAVFKWFKPSRFTLTVTSQMGQYPEKFGIRLCDQSLPHKVGRSGGRLTSLGFDDPEGMGEDEISALFMAYDQLNQPPI